jgi:hypothetical protein
MTDQFQLYGNLEILDMTKNTDVQNLVDYLTPGFGPTFAVKSILHNMLRLASIDGTPRCKTVIVEKNYTDSEFLSCYGRFYSYLFMNIPKTCIRLHFFAEKIQPRDIKDLEDRTSYLGYVVLRPISVMPVGRTVLATPANIRDDEFVTTQTSYDVNLSGSRLLINGMPYIQQDGRVAACASAALWMAIYYLSPRYGLPSKSTIEVTELATGYDFTNLKSIPGRGLTIPQMLNALSALGYSPQLYDHPWSKEAKQIIYSCIESKIPALLALTFKEGHHASLAIGHSFRSPDSPQLIREKISDKQEFTYYDNTEWIPQFIVHDDQCGLYGKLRLLPLEDFLKDDTTIDIGKLQLPPGVEPNINEVHCPIEVEYSYYDSYIPQKRVGNLFAIIVPMPPGVSLMAEDAKRKASELLIVTNYLYGSPNLSDIVLRTYLDTSNEYKESLKYRLDMPEWLRSFYRGKPMSKYIWVTEISTKELFDKVAIEERKMIGEIIIDSAASPFTPSFLILHVPEYVMTMNPEDDNFINALKRARKLPDDHPYAHAVRVSPPTK